MAWAGWISSLSQINLEKAARAKLASRFPTPSDTLSRPLGSVTLLSLADVLALASRAAWHRRKLDHLFDKLVAAALAAVSDDFAHGFVWALAGVPSASEREGSRSRIGSNPLVDHDIYSQNGSTVCEARR